MKKNYEDEIVNTKVNIIIGIIGFVALFGLYIIVNEFIHGEYGLAIFLLLGGLILIFSTACFTSIYTNIRNANINNKITKEIIENGVKVPGKIIRIKTENFRDDKNTYFKRAAYHRPFHLGGGKIVYYHYAIVQYTFKGKKHTIKSPSLWLYHEYLLSKDVDVYLYEDKYYIDNYKLNNSKIKSYKKSRMKMRIAIILLFFISAFASGVAIYLGILGTISDKLSIILCIIFMLLYMIIASIVYFKYIFSIKD